MIAMEPVPKNQRFAVTKNVTQVEQKSGKSEEMEEK